MMPYDIMRSGPKDRGMEVEIEVGKPSEASGLKFDDEEKMGKEDPLSQFEDEEILKSLEARPALLEILKNKFMEEKAPAEGGEMAGSEEAMPPSNIEGRP